MGPVHAPCLLSLGPHFRVAEATVPCHREAACSASASLPPPGPAFELLCQHSLIRLSKSLC